MTKNNLYRLFRLLFFSLLLLTVPYSNSAASQPAKHMVVIIDPGHGGKDPGAVNKGVREKDAVLGIGLKLGEMIKENFPDVKVIFTRSTDVFVPLIERSRIANRNKANLFISLHANFCGAPSIRGTETYVLGLHRSNENLEVAKKENSVILLEDNYKQTYQGFDPNLSESYIMFELAQDAYMDQSLAFAGDIQRQFDSKLTSSNRGVKQAGFLVLRESSMPSVLVETGFISNSSEAQYLMSDAGQSNIAHSILNAFRKFKEKSSGSSRQVLASQAKKVQEDDPEPVKNEDKHLAEASLRDKDSLPKHAADTSKETTKTDSPKLVQHVQPNQPVTKTKETAPSPEKKAVSGDDIYFSVQIGASTTSVETAPANFKGLKNVRKEKSDKYYRYFVGKENSLEDIQPIFIQVKKKFPNAFIVSFKGGVRTIIDPNKK